jgi:glutamine amidotransferase
MVYVAQFDFCNFGSLTRYLEVRGVPYRSLAAGDVLVPGRDSIILPGVGSFAEGIGYLQATDLTTLLRRFRMGGGKILGICLGMQLLFDASAESPGVKGLGLIPGKCERLPHGDRDPVPRIGWDGLRVKNDLITYSRASLGDHQGGNLLRPSLSDYYFVHSFYCDPEQDCIISAYFEHADNLYCASVEAGSVFGVQFHPEKSGEAGYTILDSILLRSLRRDIFEKKNSASGAHRFRRKSCHQQEIQALADRRSVNANAAHA